MSKQHDTFPNEKPEMPVQEKTPEVNQPSDPGEPKIPNEDAQEIPDELPEEKNSPGDSAATPVI